MCAALDLGTRAVSCMAGVEEKTVRAVNIPSHEPLLSAVVVVFETSFLQVIGYSKTTARRTNRQMRSWSVHIRTSVFFLQLINNMCLHDVWSLDKKILSLHLRHYLLVLLT